VAAPDFIISPPITGEKNPPVCAFPSSRKKHSSACSILPPTDLAPFFRVVTDFQGPIDWQDFFNNSQPVELDIGCGKGMSVVNGAESRPDVNFVGVELDLRIARHGAARLKRRNLLNARILGGDALQFLDRNVAPHSVQAVHVYFPDPWWKRRHRRRRLFTDRLVEQMARLLPPGGLVHSWTDVEEYFQVISALMNNSPMFRTLEVPEEQPADHDLDYHTSFERKKRKIGETIYRGKWERV